jgi:hypothetical protein
MTCRGICIRHKTQKPASNFSRYLNGQKRCQGCNLFLKWDGLWCPCCSTKLRTRPRSQKLKSKLKSANDSTMKKATADMTPIVRYV